MKRAIVDIDNTLFPFYIPFFGFLRKINAETPDPSSWKDWDFWRGIVTKEEILGAINAVHETQSEYVPYQDARDFLTSLKQDGFHITIASHRETRFYEPTKRWLDGHGLQHDEIHLSFNKTVIFTDRDVVVDDSPDVISAAVKGGLVHSGLRHPWNSHLEGSPLFDTLSEVLRYLRGVVNARP